MLRWAVGSPRWEVTHAESDLRVGGIFRIRTRERDGGESVEFVGTYTNIKDHELIEYDTPDGRRVVAGFDYLLYRKILTYLSYN